MNHIRADLGIPSDSIKDDRALELKTDKSDLVVSIGPRGHTVAKVGFALGRVTSKLIKATRDKVSKT